jgi:hypothetical protein
MTGRLQLGRDLPQCAAAAFDGIAGQPLGKRDGFRLRLGDGTPAATLARLGLLAFAGLAQLGEKGPAFRIGRRRLSDERHASVAKEAPTSLLDDQVACEAVCCLDDDCPRRRCNMVANPGRSSNCVSAGHRRVVELLDNLISPLT